MQLEPSPGRIWVRSACPLLWSACVLLCLPSVSGAAEPSLESDAKKASPSSTTGAESEGKDAGEDVEEGLGPATIVCPHCNEKGRQVCPDCRGRKHLYKECSRCAGKGRRPCQHCDKPTLVDGAEVSTPGVVTCPSCGGRGTVGSRPPRVCPKCNGEQVLSCPTCRGKGTLKCRTEVIDKICPRCRLTGRITCLACGGSRRVSARLAEVSPRSAPLTGAPRLTGVTGEAAKDAPAGKAGDPAAGKSVEERFGDLLRLHEQCDALVSSDARPALQKIQQQASNLIGPLARAADEQAGRAVSKLKQLRVETAALRERWEELLESFEVFQRTFHHCEKIWHKSDDAPSRTNTTWWEEWEEDMELTLRIAEKRAARVAKSAPTSLRAELVATEENWRRLESSATKLLDELRAASETKEKEAAARARDGAKDSRKGGAGSERPRRKKASRTSRRGKEPASGLERILRRDSVPGDGDASSRGERYRKAERGAREGGGFLAGFLWGMGLLLAVLGLHLVLRRRQVEPAEKRSIGPRLADLLGAQRRRRPPR